MQVRELQAKHGRGDQNAVSQTENYHRVYVRESISNVS